MPSFQPRSGDSLDTLPAQAKHLAEVRSAIEGLAALDTSTADAAMELA